MVLDFLILVFNSTKGSRFFGSIFMHYLNNAPVVPFNFVSSQP